MADSSPTSRRTFLKGTAVVGGVAGLGATARVGAQETGGRATVLRFGGEVGGWQATAPDDIAGTTNPTLELEAGQAYRFVWENLDGQPHNVVIIDGNGNELERTELITEEGATQSLEFTATPEMSEYYCEAHPGSMRGGMEVSGDGGGGNGGGEQTTAANGTDEGTQTPSETTAETTAQGPQLPEDFESQLEFAGERFAETMSGSLQYALFQGNLDTYQQQLSGVLDARNLAADAEPSLRQVGQTGIAIESSMDGAGLYRSTDRFFPEITPEYVAQVAQRARDEQAVTDVLGTVSTGQSPDELLRAVERQSESVASTLSPEYPDFRLLEGAVHGGLLTLKDSGRLLRLRENVASDAGECFDAAGQIGAGFLLMGRSVQNLLRSEAMSGSQAALGVLAGAAVMALGDARVHRCLWTNAISVGPEATGNNSTAANGTTVTTETAADQTTTVGNQTTGAANASAAGFRADASSTVRGDLGVLGALGGCASLVGYLLSSDE